jgi:hypothetical protein
VSNVVQIRPNAPKTQQQEVNEIVDEYLREIKLIQLNTEETPY